MTMMSRTFTTMLALVTLGGVAAGCHSDVRPDEMSADAHRREAAKLSHEANAEAQVSPTAPPDLAKNPGGNPEGYYSPVNPQDPAIDQGARSAALTQHARHHLEAARYLEASEDAACANTPVAQRAACPLLGPARTLVDIPRGVRIRFTSGARVDAILAHMRCHQAYSQARGFKDVAECPLYIRGIDIVRGPEPATIDIVSVNDDAKVTAEVRARAREEAVVVNRQAK
ncbi:MAG TPA: hypothetical protein VHU40_11455 [Polyangia bacterium]|jgi:hypothetical protein|nr:hypothetical protein [Polyangia bacterium]